MAVHTVENDGSYGAVWPGDLRDLADFCTDFKDLYHFFKPLAEVERGIVWILLPFSSLP